MVHAVKNLKPRQTEKSASVATPASIYLILRIGRAFELTDGNVVLHRENAAGRTRLALKWCAGWPARWHNLFVPHGNLGNKPAPLASAVRCFPHARFERVIEDPLRFPSVFLSVIRVSWFKRFLPVQTQPRSVLVAPPPRHALAVNSD